jgi:hypothetical protein
MRICEDRTPIQASPVVAIRKSTSTVLDRHGRGGLGKYVITTQNSEYEVYLTRGQAEQLVREMHARSP